MFVMLALLHGCMKEPPVVVPASPTPFVASARPWEVQATAAEARQDWEAAAHAWAWVARQRGDYRPANIRLGRALVRAGQLERAQEVMERAKEVDPIGRALLAHALGEVEERDHWLARARQLDQSEGWELSIQLLDSERLDLFTDWRVYRPQDVRERIWLAEEIETPAFVIVDYLTMGAERVATQVCLQACQCSLVASRLVESRPWRRSSSTDAPLWTALFIQADRLEYLEQFREDVRDGFASEWSVDPQDPRVQALLAVPCSR